MPETQTKNPSFETRIPEGDNRQRQVCSDCGFVAYENPKVVVGAVVTSGDRILLCRRAIDPRAGFWTLPAGYMELNETAEAGAMREAWEEARAHIAIDRLLGAYTIPRLSQVQLIYRARLTDPHIEPGPESLDVGLFHWADIPWNELAFPSVRWALGHFDAVRGLDHFAAFSNPADETGNLLAGER